LASVSTARDSPRAPLPNKSGFGSAAPRHVGASMTGAGSEEADDYCVIVAKLNENWRVIVWAAGIQWILQRRRGERRGRARWEGRSYCRTKAAITHLSRRFAGTIDPSATRILAALPEHIGNLSINTSEHPATATPGVASHLRATPPKPIRGRNTYKVIEV